MKMGITTMITMTSQFCQILAILFPTHPVDVHMVKGVERSAPRSKTGSELVSGEALLRALSY